MNRPKKNSGNEKLQTKFSTLKRKCHEIEVRRLKTAEALLSTMFDIQENANDGQFTELATRVKELHTIHETNRWQNTRNILRIDASDLGVLDGTRITDALESAGLVLEVFADKDSLHELSQSRSVKHVQHLILAPFGDGASVSDDDMKHVRHFTELRELNLAHLSISDEGVQHLSGLAALEVLNLDRTDITDDGLRHLSRLRKLEDLYLDSTAIGGKGISHLDEISSLRWLDLSETHVGNDAITSLCRHTALTSLNLVGTKVEDESVISLKTLVGLRQLFLNHTKVSEGIIEELKKSLPNCYIP